jgi:hypothetical protein
MNNVRWKIRSFCEGDFENVSRLRKVFFEQPDELTRRSCTPDYYRWKIQRNPVQMGILHVADDVGKVVAMATFRIQSALSCQVTTDGKTRYRLFLGL